MIIIIIHHSFITSLFQHLVASNSITTTVLPVPALYPQKAMDNNKDLEKAGPAHVNDNYIPNPSQPATTAKINKYLPSHCQTAVEKTCMIAVIFLSTVLAVLWIVGVVHDSEKARKSGLEYWDGRTSAMDKHDYLIYYGS